MGARLTLFLVVTLNQLAFALETSDFVATMKKGDLSGCMAME